MGHTWSGRAKGAWKRTILFAIPPLFIFLSFTIAGIVVSYIALDPDKSPALLKEGDLCAVVSETVGVAATQQFSNTTIISSAYVRDCYTGASTGAVACNTYNKPTLPYTIRRNDTCPLGTGSCANGDHQAVNMTTMLDSHHDLGTNAPASDRIQFGYSVTCAPMSHDLLRNLTNSSHEDNLRTDNDSYTFSTVKLARNYTSWSYSNVTAWPKLQVGAYSLFPYKSYWPHDGRYAEVGTPVAPLNQPSTDLTIALIDANGIRYLGESNDPIFATDANRKTVKAIGTLYPLKHQVSAIACTDQWQFCNGPNRCTGWIPLSKIGSGPDDVIALGQRLGMNAAQNATLVRIVYATTDGVSMYLSMFTPSPLRAADYSLGALSTSQGLPDEQWATEVITWYETSLAKIQYLTKIFVNIPSTIAKAPGYLFLHPDTVHTRNLCSQQRVSMPAGYQNFSVFGLTFVLAMGIVTLLVAFLLKKYQHKLPDRAPGQCNHSKLVSYQADSYLHLHRAAMELAGHGGWIGTHDGKTEVPYTKKAERVLTQDSLMYRGTNNWNGKCDKNGGSSSDGSTVDTKVIADSWDGTGITTVR